MKRFLLHASACAALAGTMLVASSHADEEAVGGGSGFSIDSFTIDSGGGDSSAGVWTIEGTIGQPDPGVAGGGGGFTVAGGFWTGGGATQSPCPSDLTGDGEVGFQDVVQILNDWGPCGGGDCDSDLDNNGVVGFTDLLLVLNDYGPCPA